MGNLHAKEYAAMEDRDLALAAHLQSNHYPPVSLAFVPTCKEAIKAGNAKDWDRQITMPNGLVKTAGEIIEGLHLDYFLEDGE